MAKKFISTVHKDMNMTSFEQKQTLLSGKVNFRDLYVAEMNFLAVDKYFVQDNKFLSWAIFFCLGQN